MTDVIHVAMENELKSTHDAKNEFIKDVKAGFARYHKQLQSKYFYDQYGSELFNQITRHPDYYLTKCEIEILDAYKKDISQVIGDEAFNLIELGPGEGIKTQILIEQFQKDARDFTYMPIDISTNYLQLLTRQFNQALPTLNVTPIHSDYFNGLEWLNMNSSRRNLVLFLGSSIGNLDPVATDNFLKHLSNVLNQGDYVLLGFDLRKDINVLMRAYNDSDGITRHFNLNLLERMNRELGANFNAAKFRHYCTYNVYSGAMESYLISLEKQHVDIEALGQSYTFEAIEPIHVEYSHKYLLSHVDQLAKESGFSVVQSFVDSRQYFVDTLWQVGDCK